MPFPGVKLIKVVVSVNGKKILGLLMMLYKKCFVCQLKMKKKNCETITIMQKRKLEALIRVTRRM